jgi:mRNA-degrading endonuclease RelE of RelBE toxin-antitoxin system
MGDRIEKILRTLPAKQRKQLIVLIELIIAGKFQGMDVKKLKGHESAYRVRKGNFRIIFIMPNSDEIRIIALERRTDTTYHGI